MNRYPIEVKETKIITEINKLLNILYFSKVARQKTQSIDNAGRYGISILVPSICEVLYQKSMLSNEYRYKILIFGLALKNNRNISGRNMM
jgi:hypothetical protein